MKLKILLVFCCGGAGSALRYALSGWVQRLGGATFPVGTLAVNLIGCFAIGLLTPFLSGPFLIREEYRVAVFVGLLGGFTTFSTYAWECMRLAGDGQFARACLNLVLSNVLGILAAFIGYRLAQAGFGV
jgi:CrcB protein